MAIPHSRSVHLLIDLLVADSVMELSSSDYHKQTGYLFVCSSRICLQSFSTSCAQVKDYTRAYGHVNRSSKTQSPTELFEQNEKGLKVQCMLCDLLLDRVKTR